MNADVRELIRHHEGLDARVAHLKAEREATLQKIVGAFAPMRCGPRVHGRHAPLLSLTQHRPYFTHNVWSSLPPSFPLQADEDVLLNNRKQECVRLRSRIVHNPEKLKQVWAAEPGVCGARAA